MADALKVRVLIMNPETEEVIGEADVQTIAELVYFADKETLQQKYDSGELKGKRVIRELRDRRVKPGLKDRKEIRVSRA